MEVQAEEGGLRKVIIGRVRAIVRVKGGVVVSHDDFTPSNCCSFHIGFATGLAEGRYWTRRRQKLSRADITIGATYVSRHALSAWIHHTYSLLLLQYISYCLFKSDLWKFEPSIPQPVGP